MNIVEFYKQTPLEKHHEIVVSGDRVFFDGEEYVLRADGELKLVRSQKGLEQKLDQIKTAFGVADKPV
jgi:hypothetical protein